MQVDGHAERFGAFKHWLEELIVKVTPADVAIYQCPTKWRSWTQRSSSRAAVAGSRIGSVANPRNRSGYLEIKPAARLERPV
jgi:hypothetical protein